jgi:hypothetical protein
VPAEITTHGSFGNNLGSPARIQVRRRPRPQRRGDAQGQSRQPRPNRSRRRANDKRRHRELPYNMEQQPTRAGDGAPRVLVKSSESNCITGCGTLRSGSPERGSMNQNIRSVRSATLEPSSVEFNGWPILRPRPAMRRDLSSNVQARRPAADGLFFNAKRGSKSELRRQVAVDFEPDADFHKCGSCPEHSSSPQHCVISYGEVSVMLTA